MFGIDDGAFAIMAAALASSAGSLYTNTQNLKNQKWINNVNWDIAAANNATQVNLANTAHQREVADLRAAGLNPILSAGGHGATTPSLTSMRGDSAQIENPVNGIASSAKQLASYLSDQYRTDLDIAKMDLQQLQRDATRDDVDSINDVVLSHLEQDSLKDYLGLGTRHDKDGNLVVTYDDPDKYRKAMELKKDAIDASIRDASNVNWRNNLRSVGGAVGDLSSIAGGASALMRATDALRRTRHDLSTPRRKGYRR